MTDKTDLPLRPTRSTQHFMLHGREDAVYEFIGRQLATSSSYHNEHRHAGSFAPKRWPCSACRWFELGLYACLDPDVPMKKYVVHTRGETKVPGEKTYARVVFADDAYQVLELLTQWRGHGDAKVPTLPDATLDALEDASEEDPDIAEALRAWLNAGA